MKRFLLAGLFLFGFSLPAHAQSTPVQNILQTHSELIQKSSRKTIQPAIDAMASSGLAQVQDVLQAWQAKDMWLRETDGLYFRAEKIDAKTYELFDFDTGESVGPSPKADLEQIKPNSGIRALIAIALVQFQLSDPDVEKRRDALTSILRDPKPEALEPLRASIPTEDDPELLAIKQHQERLLTIAFDDDDAERIIAMDDMSTSLSVDVRGTLNTLMTTNLRVFEGAAPADLNIARVLMPGTDMPEIEAYALLAANDFAPARISAQAMKATLEANIEGGLVGGVPIAGMDDPAERLRAYKALVAEGKATPFLTDPQVADLLAQHSFVEVYSEPSAAVTDAAVKTLASIESRVGISQTIDLTLDALSLASIYFLAAIGLAITFGVMGVINMAHGEFIMMGAYTGYMVQQFIPNHTVSIVVAIPLAFAITFAAGVLMERLVIRWLYNRPLETLLATFGISIALQQLAKNIFGTQARPLTSPEWLDGAWVINDVVAISHIRIAIFVLALGFLALLLFIMKRTRLGLETRAVTQNRKMAASMGINPDRVNMLTFGLGSGIAGIAGVAIGLFAKVTSELGNDYIVQSFMTVVVGGVGSIWGTLAGAVMIGFSQKGIEWFTPSNTLAAQTYMIILIILFIQFRPRGIVALKGRAAGD